MPAELATFDPGDWPSSGADDLGEPYLRWAEARRVWARQRGVDPRTLPGRLSSRERMAAEARARGR